MRFIGAAPATIRSRISACAALIRASSSRRPGSAGRSFGFRGSAGFWHHRIFPASGPSVTMCAWQCFASGLSLRGYGASHSCLIFTGFGADGGTAFLTQSQRSLTKTAVFSARHAGLPQIRQSLSMCGPVMPSPSRAVLFTVFLQSAHHSGWRSAQGILRMSRAPASQSACPIRSGSVWPQAPCRAAGSASAAAAASRSQKTCPAFFSAMIVRQILVIADSPPAEHQRSLTPSSRAISARSCRPGERRHAVGLLQRGQILALQVLDDVRYPRGAVVSPAHARHHEQPGRPPQPPVPADAPSTPDASGPARRTVGDSGRARRDRGGSPASSPPSPPPASGTATARSPRGHRQHLAPRRRGGRHAR